MYLIELIIELDSHDVKYAIAGGHAVALHGAVRGTLDIDLVVDLNEDNLLRLESALKKLGLESKVPVNASDIYNFREEYIEKRNLIAWSFYNPVDSSQIVDVVITHDLSKMKADTVSVQGHPVRVLSKSDLIKMKRDSARPQDLEDVKALESIS